MSQRRKHSHNAAKNITPFETALNINLVASWYLWLWSNTRLKKRVISNFVWGTSTGAGAPKRRLYVIECARLESWRDVHHSLKTTELTCEWPSPRRMVLTSGGWSEDATGRTTHWNLKKNVWFSHRYREHVTWRKVTKGRGKCYVFKRNKMPGLSECLHPYRTWRLSR